MKKSVSLPLSTPLYSTYQFQGTAGAVLSGNPSLRNWYYNHVLILRSNRSFLRGRTTPDLSISDSSLWDNPYLEKKIIPMQFLGGHVHHVIRSLLDNRWYVSYNGVDDYYVKGKSMYKTRHFNHDGMIFGYDQNDRTYSLFSYDESWVFRPFRTPQKCFDNGKRAMFNQGVYGELCGIKPKSDTVSLDPATLSDTLRTYLSSTLETYPPDADGTALGTVVQYYLALYLDKLIDGGIPYARADKRIFRLLWEHKKVMYQRIRAFEEAFGLGSDCGNRFAPLVKEADHMRMLYASHFLKRRDSLLPVLRKTLLSLKEREEAILTDFLGKLGGIPL